jgi:DNA-binding transcriptional ArsR family regulator
LKVVASARRQAILRAVWDTERTAGAIHAAFPDVTFGAISQQLRTLRLAGLVDVRRDRRHRYYRARREGLGHVRPLLERLWDDALWRLKLEAELAQERRGPQPRRGRGALSRASKRTPRS